MRMIHFLRCVPLIFALLLTMSGPVLAGQPFNSAAFESAQAEGKSILVHIKAPWCPTCKEQQPTINAVAAENPALVIFDVDYDTAKDVMARFGARTQSTLIVFKGKTEINRSSGQTDPALIRAQIAKGL